MPTLNSHDSLSPQPYHSASSQANNAMCILFCLACSLGNASTTPAWSTGFSLQKGSLKAVLQATDSQYALFFAGVEPVGFDAHVRHALQPVRIWRRAMT